MSRRAPPRLAMWLLRWFVPERDGDAVLGDLSEEYALRAQSAGEVAASRWYWRQMCRSIPPIMWMSLRHGRWIPTLAVAISAYVAAGVVEFAGTTAIATLLTPDTRVSMLLSVVVGLTTLACAGCIAEWIRGGAARVLATIVGLAVVALMVTVPNSAPLWYGLAFLVFGPVAALAGGTICSTVPTPKGAK